MISILPAFSVGSQKYAVPWSPEPSWKPWGRHMTLCGQTNLQSLLDLAVSGEFSTQPVSISEALRVFKTKTIIFNIEPHQASAWILILQYSLNFTAQPTEPTMWQVGKPLPRIQAPRWLFWRRPIMLHMLHPQPYMICTYSCGVSQPCLTTGRLKTSLRIPRDCIIKDHSL
jgi:hypothetical protein